MKIKIMNNTNTLKYIFFIPINYKPIAATPELQAALAPTIPKNTAGAPTPAQGDAKAPIIKVPDAPIASAANTL